MNNATTKALFLGLLALAVMAAPTASAEEAEPEEEGPCQVVETMTFYPYVVLHPECLPAALP